MAATRYSSNVLEMFYGLTIDEENRNLPQPLQPVVVGRYNGFVLAQNNFREWLRVWKMVVPEDYEYKSDLLVFARETKSRFINLVEIEIEALQSVKVSGEMQRMEHYFREKDPHVFRRQNEDGIKIEFDRFVERTKGEIEAWSERGSG